ncbi:CDP-alcohol phosphatidyltransferase family protein [candidate division KSB1 bacterium]|nr:CDP-alcohol phosphatidyltransferase family protein [candidate division KSB1 bacterium]
MKRKFIFIPGWILNGFITLLIPTIDFFVKRRLNPNHLTTVGLILSLPTAYLFATGFLRTGGFLMLIGGVFDIIDGKVARATNRITKFGALYDSTLDRYSELMILFGLAYYFVTSGWRIGEFNFSLITAVVVSMAIGGSVMTSYVRARSEGLGLKCKVGMMQRPDRVVWIGFGALFHEYALVAAIIIVAVFSNITALQRLYTVWKSENIKKEESASEDDVY